MFDETEARELDHEPGHGAREGAADGGEESDDVDKVSEWVGVGVCVLREGEGEGRQAGRQAGRQTWTHTVTPDPRHSRLPSSLVASTRYPTNVCLT